MQFVALVGWSALFIFYENITEHDAIPPAARATLFAHALLLGLVNGAVGVALTPFGPAAVGGSSITIFFIATRTGRAVAQRATRRIFRREDNAETAAERIHAHEEVAAD